MNQFEILLNKDNPLLDSIKQRGFEIPTEIQEKSIPAVLQGRDVIAGAATGSGKTLAFAAGLTKNVKKDFGIQGIVLTPTRELAEQITNELKNFTKSKNLEVTSIYGGVSINNQIKRLSYSDIIVGTPGRILDHLERNTIDLSRINTLVLDEADRMLDMGFRDDVEKIIMKCNKKRQTLLFSATISQDIVHLAQKYLINPIEIAAEPHIDESKLEQIYYDVGDNLKYSLLKHLLENEKGKLVMVFCNTRRNVDFIANNLKIMKIEALPLHGGFTQDKRSKILKSFHSEKIKVLVTTDVAARGLDIPGITHIYNYDIPSTEKDYIHRIGRTARAGKDGKVINILSSRDYENFDSITSGEINIIRKETPFIKREIIKWVSEGDSRGSRGNNRFDNRENKPRSDGRRSDSGRSNSGRSDSRRSDSGRSNSGRSDGRRSNSGRSDGRRSNSGRSDGRRSDGRRSDSGRSNSGRSDGRRSDSGRSDNRDYNKRKSKRF